ncbi:MAG: RluA family pseudouridine synthase [Phycisphaerae bacterium]|nr:RluA family pseudouridine synthase [Phycisphaerae bacterium]
MVDPPDPTFAPRIRVVHATDAYAVVDKPHRMLSVPGKGPNNADCAAARVAAMFPRATGPMVVHRLDMDTSGLIVFALDAPTQRALSAQFERRRVEKAYVALVDGEVPVESGVIDVPVRADLARRPMQIVDPTFPHGAQTSFRVLAYEADRTRVEFTPRTGRTHQLRVHAAYAGPGGWDARRPHPILGDVLYGPGTDAPRLMLHATRLAFAEPATGRWVGFSCPPSF